MQNTRHLFSFYMSVRPPVPFEVSLRNDLPCFTFLQINSRANIELLSTFNTIHLNTVQRRSFSTIPFLSSIRQAMYGNQDDKMFTYVISPKSTLHLKVLAPLGTKLVFVYNPHRASPSKTEGNVMGRTSITLPHKYVPIDSQPMLLHFVCKMQEKVLYIPSDPHRPLYVSCVIVENKELNNNQTFCCKQEISGSWRLILGSELYYYAVICPPKILPIEEELTPWDEDDKNNTASNPQEKIKVVQPCLKHRDKTPETSKSLLDESKPIADETLCEGLEWLNM